MGEAAWNFRGFSKCGRRCRRAEDVSLRKRAFVLGVPDWPLQDRCHACASVYCCSPQHKRCFALCGDSIYKETRDPGPAASWPFTLSSRGFAAPCRYYNVGPRITVKHIRIQNLSMHYRFRFLTRKRKRFDLATSFALIAAALVPALELPVHSRPKLVSVQVGC